MIRMDKKELLKKRNESKRKKPEFVRQDAHKKPRLGKKWRRPKGIDSKMRLSLKGHRKKPSKGYKSPSAVRGLSREGLEMRIVSSLKDVELLKTDTEGAVISGKVGKAKKVAIVRALVEKKAAILNIKDPSLFLQKVEEEEKKRKEEKEKKKKEKKKKEEEKKRKAEEKAKKEKEEKEKAKEEKETQGIKKKPEAPEDKEKKEKDKILATKDVQ